MDRKPSPLAWVQRFVLGGVVVALLAIGAQATGNAAAELALSDGTSWLVNPPTGEAIQVNTVTAEITARVEVAEDGDPLEAVQLGPSAVVLDKATGSIRKVDGVLLDTTAETTSSGNPADLELVEGGGQPWLVDTVGGAATSLDPTSLEAQVRADVPPGSVGAAADDDGHLWLADPAEGSVVRVDPDSEGTTTGVTDAGHHIAPAVASGLPALVDATGGAVFELDDSGELRDEFCLTETPVEPGAPLLTGGSPAEDDRRVVLSVVAELGALVVTDLDSGTCDTEEIGRAVQSDETGAEYGTPVMSGGYAYVPDLSMGSVIVVDLEEMRTIERLPILTDFDPFELFVDNGVVVYNNLVGPEWGIIEGNRHLRGEPKYDDGSGNSGATVIGEVEDGDGTGTTVEGDDERGDEGEPGNGDGDEPDEPDTTDTSSVDRPDNGDGDNPEDLEEGELPDDEGDGDDGSGEGTGDGTPDSPTPPPPRSEEDTGGEVLEETDIDVDANFQYSPDGPYVVGQTVRFVDTSAGAPTSWTWNFGDGTAQGPDVTHAWDTPGQWPVTLTVSNGSVSDEISTLVTVTDPDVAQPPTADFTFSTRSPRVGDPVRFTDRSTNDPTAWSWDFGDGTTGAGPQVSHTWSEPGPKTIVLTASNDEGQDTAQVQIIVVDRIEPPVAEIEIDRTTLKTGEDVRLTDASSGNPTDVIWRFGDGTQRRAAPGATISHQWSQAEDYEVELIVSNDAGDDTASVVVTVEPAIDPPTVEISGDDTVEVGRPLGLNAITTNNPTRIEWDFGDDTAANGASVSKTWDEIGDYVVNVEVENEAGVDDTDIVVTVTPKVLPPLEADFERNPRRADVGQEVQFTDRSSGAIVSWQWDFDDGGTSSDPNPTHVFDEPGVYSVRLVVTDENGETDPQRRNVRVEGGRAPEANFQFRPGEPRAGQEVQFTSTSEGDINRYRWQFGDGGTARGANPVHVFESGNDYEVTLTVRNPSGESSSTRVVRVTPELRDPPEAAFVVETAGPLVAGQPITFRDTTPGQVGTPQWTFPTGQRLPDQPGARTITYRFEGPGEFPVSMEVCWADDAQNCSRATRQVSVQAPAEPPVASFEIVGDGVLSQDQIIANRPVTFRSTATGGGIDDYTWTINGRTFDGAEVRDVVVSGATEIVVAHTASNDAGPSAPAQRRITVVTAEPPVARFEAPGQAAVGEPVQFTDTSTGAPIRWRWNFGDNTPEVIEQSPVHTFNTPGNYQVTLVAENDWGASQPVTRNIQIQDAPEPPVSQPEVQLADGTVIPQGSPVPIGTEVLLVNNSTSPNIAYVEWELLPFDLGNVQVAPGQAYPTQALGFPGERTVRSRVVTTDGQTSPWVPYTVVLTLG